MSRPDVRARGAWDLEVRIGGRSSALDARLKRAADLLDTDVTVVSGGADAVNWRARRELSWAAPDASVLKLPLTPATAGTLEQVLVDLVAAQVARVYSAGVQQAFVAWPAERTAELPALGQCPQRSAD